MANQIPGVPEDWEVDHVNRIGEVGEHCISDHGEPVLLKYRTAGRVCIIRKIEKPAKYRPFANAAEFESHRDRWWYRDDNKVRRHFPPASYSDEAHGGANWRHRFDTCFFDDGTPFGVKIDE
jgi:hypothetical protein